MPISQATAGPVVVNAMMQLEIMGSEFQQCTLPPPSSAALSENVQLVSPMSASSQTIPPPSLVA